MRIRSSQPMSYAGRHPRAEQILRCGASEEEQRKARKRRAPIRPRPAPLRRIPMPPPEHARRLQLVRFTIAVEVTMITSERWGRLKQNPKNTRRLRRLRRAWVAACTAWRSQSPTAIQQSEANSSKLRFPYVLSASAIAFSLITGASAVGIWLGYSYSQPTAPVTPATGSIRVYFDRPGVFAFIRVRVKPQGPESGYGEKYELYIRTVGSEGNLPSYQILLGGSARPATRYGAGANLERDQHGCLPTISGVYEDVTCEEIRGQPDSLSASDEAGEPLTVISGQLSNVAEGDGHAIVDVQSRLSAEKAKGSNTTFQLPSIGTTSLPDDLRDKLPIPTGKRTKGYSPNLSTYVEYIPLSATEDLTVVSPEPDARVPLSWSSVDNGAIEPAGTITDLRRQRNAERTTFLLGALAGVVGGLLVPLSSVWYTTVRQVRSWKRNTS